jgi:transporter family protein
MPTWVTLALLAAFGGGVYAVLSKAGLKQVDPHLGLAVQSVVILAVAWGAVAVRGQLGRLGEIGGRTWAVLVAAGAVTGVSYLLLFRALKDGEASRVTPLDRLSLVFAVVLAWVFLGERVSLQVGLGAALMAGGAVLIALAE